MRAYTVVSLDEEERIALRPLLPSIALAFPDREREGTEGHAHWKVLGHLLHSDWLWTEESYEQLQRALHAAESALAARADAQFWRLQGEQAVPGSATPPDQVLAESAQLALRNLGELQRLAAEIGASLPLPV